MNKLFILFWTFFLTVTSISALCNPSNSISFQNYYSPVGDSSMRIDENISFEVGYCPPSSVEQQYCELFLNGTLVRNSTNVTYSESDGFVTARYEVEIPHVAGSFELNTTCYIKFSGYESNKTVDVRTYFVKKTFCSNDVFIDDFEIPIGEKYIYTFNNSYLDFDGSFFINASQGKFCIDKSYDTFVSDSETAMFKIEDGKSCVYNGTLGWVAFFNVSDKSLTGYRDSFKKPVNITCFNTDNIKLGKKNVSVYVNGIPNSTIGNIQCDDNSILCFDFEKNLSEEYIIGKYDGIDHNVSFVKGLHSPAIYIDGDENKYVEIQYDFVTNDDLFVSLLGNVTEISDTRVYFSDENLGIELIVPFFYTIDNFTAEVYSSSAPLEGISCYANIPMSTNTWYHFVTASSSTDLKYYMNGTQICSTGSAPYDHSGNMRLGRGLSKPYFGALDDFRFYKRNLSDQDIQSLYEGKRLLRNLLGEYLFNDYNTTDTSQLARGKIGKGFLFDGFNNSIHIAYNSSLNADSGRRSVSLWVFMFEDNFDNSIHYIVNDSVSGIAIFVENNTLKAMNCNGVCEGLSYGGSSDFVDKWNHIVYTYDTTGTQNLYINDKLVNTSNTAKGFVQTTSDIFLGSKDGTESFFSGIIDEFILYNSTLATTTINELFSRGNDIVEIDVNEINITGLSNGEESEPIFIRNTCSKPDYGDWWVKDEGCILNFDEVMDYVSQGNKVIITNEVVIQ